MNIGYIQITTFSDEEVSDKFSEKLNELKETRNEKTNIRFKRKSRWIFK